MDGLVLLFWDLHFSLKCCFAIVIFFGIHSNPQMPSGDDTISDKKFFFLKNQTYWLETKIHLQKMLSKGKQFLKLIVPSF